MVFFYFGIFFLSKKQKLTRPMGRANESLEGQLGVI